MDNRKDLDELQNKYKTMLENLHHALTHQQTHYSRNDMYVIPNIQHALKAIASNDSFKPQSSGSFMAHEWESLSNPANNPREFLSRLVNDVTWQKILAGNLRKNFWQGFNDFRNEINKIFPELNPKPHPKPNPLSSRPKPNALSNVVMYRSKNDELAVKFQDVEMATAFVQQLGGTQIFDKKDKFNANKSCPARYPDNPQVLYFPAYVNNGKLAAVFATPKMRDNFYNLLIKMPRHETGSKFIDPGTEYTPVRKDSGKQIRFEDKRIIEQGGNISLRLLDETLNNLKPMPKPELPPRRRM